MAISALKYRFWHLTAILICALLLCAVALYNSFPLTFNSDTGVYINSGFTGELREDRPIIYGLFLAAASLDKSLWGVVLCQSLILSLLIYYVFRYMGDRLNFLWFYVSFVFVAALFMSASFEASWLMPDVFTSCTILCIALLLFCNKLKARDFAVISAIDILSIAVHNSHFYISIILGLAILVGHQFGNMREAYAAMGLRIKRVLLIIALALLSSISGAAVNKYYGGDWRSSHGGVIFLLSNLVEMGVVDSYLNESCERTNYSLCSFRDSIPNDFLWSEKSPLNKTGGWAANEAEYWRIEKDILSTPKYLIKVLFKSVIYTFKQFFNYDFNHIRKPTVLVRASIRDHFPDEYNSYVSSKQCTNKMSFGLLNYSQNILVALSLFLYTVLLFYGELKPEVRLFFVFFITAVVFNAWLCSTFSGVYSRYQTRVTWLMLLPVFIHFQKEFSLTIQKRIYLKIGRLVSNKPNRRP